MKKDEIVTLKVKDIIPYARNNKIHGEKQIRLLKSAIQESGYDVYIVVDEDNVILKGHGRLQAITELGWEEVKCIKRYGLSKTDKKYIRIADNKLADLSDYDEEMLRLELEELRELDFDLEMTGFDDVELNDFLTLDDEQEITEDEVPEVDETKPAYSKLGDIWLLGRHRLMCGDSTDKETVERLMDGKKADMVFTDPPYKIETEGGCVGNIGASLKKQGKEIEFISNFNPTDFLKNLPMVFDKNKINAYVFCNKDLLPEYLTWARDNKYSFNVLIWKKPNAIPIGDSHRPDIEYLLLFRKSAIWNNGLKDVNYSRCLEFGREKGLHPTMKPIELISNEIKISSNKDSVIADLFGGSGSTLIACEQTNRICYIMELDEKYVDVIVKRYNNLGKDDITLIRDGKEYKWEEIKSEVI